jgi:hypothetical protein
LAGCVRARSGDCDIDSNCASSNKHADVGSDGHAHADEHTNADTAHEYATSHCDKYSSVTNGDPHSVQYSSPTHKHAYYGPDVYLDSISNTMLDPVQ